MDPHKYWYDILMGFKSELLIAYVVTLVAVVALTVVYTISVHAKIDDATTHQENMMDLSNDRLRIEKGQSDEE